MFGLDVDALRETREAMEGVEPIQKVLIYGSRAGGNHKPGSDVDITLIGKGLTPDNSVHPLLNALDDLFLPYKFDVSILKNIGDPNLAREILETGRPFYQRKRAQPGGSGKATSQDFKKIAAALSAIDDMVETTEKTLENCQGFFHSVVSLNPEKTPKPQCGPSGILKCFYEPPRENPDPAQKKTIAKITEVKKQTDRLIELHGKKLDCLKELRESVLERILNGEFAE